MEKIVLVEKEDSLRMLLEMALRSARYKPLCFAEPQRALPALQDMVPDAVMIGSLPDKNDAITLLRHIRRTDATAATPVMMLVEREDTYADTHFLAAGASECVKKPFSVMELCARLRTMMARREKSKNDIEMVSGPLCLCPSGNKVYLHGEALKLTRKEFDLLCNLMSNAGRAVPREELLRDVWGYTFIGESRTLDMHIGTLRQKLGDNASQPVYIKTIRSTGYRFIAPVFTTGKSKRSPSGLPSPA